MKQKFLKIIVTLLVPVFLLGISLPAHASFPVSSLIEQYSEFQDQFKDLFSEMDDETIKKAFDFLQEKTADGSLDTEAGIENAISEAKEKFNFEIGDQHVENMIDLIVNLENMGFKTDEIIDKAKTLYDEHGMDFINHTDELIADVVKSSWGTIVLNAIGEFFKKLGEWIADLVSNIF
jgi:uncharacterized protein YpuA (DUF1002 family)